MEAKPVADFYDHRGLGGGQKRMAPVYHVLHHGSYETQRRLVSWSYWI